MLIFAIFALISAQNVALSQQTGDEVTLCNTVPGLKLGKLTSEPLLCLHVSFPPNKTSAGKWVFRGKMGGKCGF
jgi:hypothetical protein